MSTVILTFREPDCTNGKLTYGAEQRAHFEAKTLREARQEAAEFIKKVRIIFAGKRFRRKLTDIYTEPTGDELIKTAERLLPGSMKTARHVARKVARSGGM